MYIQVLVRVPRERREQSRRSVSAIHEMNEGHHSVIFTPRESARIPLHIIDYPVNTYRLQLADEN
jgi:hypothetical protein